MVYPRPNTFLSHPKRDIPNNHGVLGKKEIKKKKKTDKIAQQVLLPEKLGNLRFIPETYVKKEWGTHLHNTVLQNMHTH